MPTVVVPFRAGGKSRLPPALRVVLAQAMLGDVLEAAAAVSDRVRLVTNDVAALETAAEFDVDVIADPGGGQGAAVAAALADIEGRCLVVNADLPSVSPGALIEFATQSAALVAAADGTTNALALPGPAAFAPLYGPGSAARFESAGFTAVSIAELEQDVDTLEDLERLTVPVGARTARVVSHHGLRLAPAL